MLRHLLLLALVLVGCTSSPGGSSSSSSALTGGPLTFEQWKERYLASPQDRRAELEPEGAVLAEERREGFRALLLADPERALEQAVSPVELAALPASVVRHLERWLDGIGTLHVIAGVGEEDSPPTLERFVTFGTGAEVLRAGVFGGRLESGTRQNVRLHGVALDGAIAVTDRRLRRLFPGEARPLLPVELPRSCPVSRKLAEPDLLFHGGDALYGFCVPLHAEQYDGTLALGEDQAAADEGLPPASTWTEGAKTVLYVRVDFSDRAGDPLSASSAQSSIDTATNTFYQSNSFGKTSLSAVVTPTLRLPRTQVDYRTNDQYLLLRADALGAARDAGFDPNLYSFDVIAFASTYSGWAGRGYVGSKGTWLNGNFSLRVTAHELGHNYGVYHANYWNAAGLTVIGPGTNTEYGNPFDVMGGGGGQGNHFNAWFKRRFDWVVSSEVTPVTSSGTYRIFELEKPITSGLHALKVTRDAQKDYWVEYRPAIATAHTRDGVSINWGYAGNTGSHLLDLTPGDGSRTNSTLIIGRTFSDSLAGIHFTPVAKGGTTPESVDLVVNLGTFPGNQPPVLSLAASTLTPAVNGLVTFTATASDPDGDALAYAWDFDDGTWGANAAVVTKAFLAAREYNVRLTVSDMKGGTVTRALLVTVGTPTTFTLSGTVLAGATPVSGVRISDGTRATFTAADGTYALTNVPAGSVTLTAAKIDFTFTRGFAAPLTVSASQAALDFTAAPVAGYTLRGKVSFGATNIAGAVVSDGSRAATTNASGDYVLMGVPTGRYTLTATKPGWDLRPSGFTNPLEVFGGDVSALNFFATGQTLYGTIPAAGVATAPVVTDGVRTVTATAGGANWNYYLSAVPNGSWNLVATSPGVTLTPSSFTNPVVMQGMSRGNLNFQVMAGTSFQVRGTVRTGGTPLPNVVVSDGTRSATTDSLGNYALVGVPAGTYTLTPTLAGYTFVPATLAVTVSTANLTGRDFNTTMVNLPPTVATAASATPSPVTATTTQLSVLAADDTGEPSLTYSWNVVGSWPVTFSANGTNSAKNATVTFTGAGTYTFECLVTDPGGLTVRSPVVVQVQQVSTGLDVTPANATVMTGAMQSFQATQRDQFNRAMFAGSPAWTVSGGGTIGAAGSVVQFTAGATAGGPFVVTVTVGTRTATALVTVAGSGSPTITAVASATPNPVPGTTTQLAVRATDDTGEPALVYRWSTSLAPAPVTFATNDDNASKDVVATFTEAGDYEFIVTVVDGAGNTVSSAVSVTVQATPTALDVQPRVVNLQVNQSQAFAATVTDQFGAPLSPQPTVNWTATVGGTVDGTGLFLAGATPGGPHPVTATTGALAASAQVTIGAAPDTQGPTVSLAQPLAGARLIGPSALAATATDDVGVVLVEFFADGTVALGQAASSPWDASFDASTLADGAHVLTARAIDAAGNATTSDGVSIVVGALPADTTPPMVQVLTPAADATTTLGVAVEVQASDDVGVAEVELELDGAAVATLTGAPWTRSLDVPPGPHSLVAIATDAAGNSTRSAAVSFIAAAEEGAPGPPMPPEPERVIGGCGCGAVDATPFHLLLGLLGLALRTRRK
ncbi:MAG: Ig-like domain-containing protein [Archangium sp.]|nr:Ig-like domain-containing protein [Archangium sp.]